MTVYNSVRVDGGMDMQRGLGLFDFSFDDLGVDQEDEECSEGLCVPQDPIEDLEWFPNFKDDLISIDDTLLEGPKTPKKNGDMVGRPVLVENFQRREELQMVPSKKTRSKRVFSRDHSWSHLLPIKKQKTLLKGERICKHCGTDSTPMWRMGPSGPNTLCNACGVRYRTGRLVPEYRPLSSPSFDSVVHSNSHRKIMKMRREPADR